VSGLLCDIGYLVLVAECPNELSKARQLSAEKGIPQYEAERVIIGASHAEIGAYLLALWGFPYSIIEAVAHHHEPHSVAHSEFDLLSLLAIAVALTGGEAEINTGNGEPMGEHYLKAVNAPFTWEKAQEIFQEIKSAGDASGA